MGSHLKHSPSFFLLEGVSASSVVLQDDLTDLYAKLRVAINEALKMQQLLV